MLVPWLTRLVYSMLSPLCLASSQDDSSTSVTSRCLWPLRAYSWLLQPSSSLSARNSGILLSVRDLLSASVTYHVSGVQRLSYHVQLASGFVFGPTATVIAHWFKKRRASVLAFVTMGASIGGTLFPILFRNLVVRVG